MFADEVKSGDRVILKVFENEAGVKIKLPGHGGSEKYFYDNTFGPECTQERLYQSAAKPIVDNVLKGMNCCIFAYGQTGTGGLTCGTAPFTSTRTCVCSVPQRRVPGVTKLRAFVCARRCSHACACACILFHYGPCVHALTCVYTHVCLHASLGVCVCAPAQVCMSTHLHFCVRASARGISCSTAYLSASRPVVGAFMCVALQARPTP
jgi:hypothetical protein